jgi:hypothetical protein
MKLLRKNITKRRRLVYRHRRRRIIRGGDIDNDANEIINRLSTYDHNSIADLLETIKDSPDFKAEVIKYKPRFDEKIKRSTCHYMETFDKFANEILITAIGTLRSRPTETTSNEDDETTPPKLTPDIVYQLYQGKDLNALIGALLDKYLSAQDNPCLLMKGTSATLHMRFVPKPKALQRHPLRGSLEQQQQSQPRGGSRRKNNRRTRRTQRGGIIVVIFIIIGAILLGIAAGSATFYLAYMQEQGGL